MSTSNTLTKTDLANILNEIVAIDGTDMTSQEISDFVDSLNLQGGTYYVTQRHEISVGTVSANGYVQSTGTVAKSGYTPMGVMGFTINSSYIFPSQIELTSASSGSGTVSYQIRNIASGQATGIKIYVTMLWHKA